MPRSFNFRVNGHGDTFLRLAGPKHIGLKDGDSNLYYRGQAPTIDRLNGNGKVIPER